MADKGIEYEYLDRFAGRWNTEGRILASEKSPEIKISGTDTYDWILDGFYLLHKADVIIGNEKSETFEIIGFDKASSKYIMQYFDNKGKSGSMSAYCKNEIWTFQGENLRFTGGFKNLNKEFSGSWEILNDRKKWTLFMDIKLIKN